MLVTQTIDQNEAVVRKSAKEAPFKQWQHQLRRGYQLPRGKYFKGKKAGRPIMIMDEAWKLLNK